MGLRREDATHACVPPCPPARMALSLCLTVVVISVHVEDFLPLDREESGEDTLLEARAEDDRIVLLIHRGGEERGGGGTRESERTTLAAVKL